MTKITLRMPVIGNTATATIRGRGLAELERVAKELKDAPEWELVITFTPGIRQKPDAIQPGLLDDAP